MKIVQAAVTAGLAGEKLSRTITGTSEVSAGRSAVAAGSGALLGGVATGAVTLGASAVGLSSLVAVAAPVVIPVTLASAVVACIRSFWD